MFRGIVKEASMSFADIPNKAKDYIASRLVIR
jgi:hypothetical protein